MVAPFPGCFLSVTQLTQAGGLQITARCSTIGVSGASAPPFIVDRLGDIMATSPTFDADKLRASSQHLRDAAAIYAGKVAVRAALFIWLL